MSRVGKQPVDLPDGVSATISGQTIEIKGPKDISNFTASDDVNYQLKMARWWSRLAEHRSVRVSNGA